MQIALTLFGLAGVALVASMWQSLRRPPRDMVRPCVRWHATRVTLTATAATLGALCVLIAVQQLS